MKTVNLNPLPRMRDRAVSQINSRYSHLYLTDAHRRLAHTKKAEQARDALSGDIAPTFAAEADLRGMSIADFAHLVLAKAAADDGWDHVELERQRALLAIDAAQTPAEIDDIVKGAR